MLVQSGIHGLEAIIEECMPYLPALRTLNRDGDLDESNLDDKSRNPFAFIHIDW
jgi:hypothetical protein